MYFSGSISEPKFQNLRLLSFHNFCLMNLFCYWFWPRTFVNGGRRLYKRYYTRGDNIHWHWDILNDRLNWHRRLIQWKVSTNYFLGLKEYLFLLWEERECICRFDIFQSYSLHRTLIDCWSLWIKGCFSLWNQNPLLWTINQELDLQVRQHGTVFTNLIEYNWQLSATGWSYLTFNKRSDLTFCL